MSEMTREQMVEFPDDCDFWTTEQWRAVAKRYHAEWRKSALTARSEGFREGVEASKRLCDAEAEYRRLRHDKPLPGDADPTIQAHKQVTAHKLGQAISALSPRETDVGYANAHPRELDAPAASAPSGEVAEMVKRLHLDGDYLRDYQADGWTKVAGCGDTMYRAAALLSKIGQGQGPAAINWTTEGCPKHHGQPWTFTATAYTELGKRCPLCNPPPPERP